MIGQTIIIISTDGFAVRTQTREANNDEYWSIYCCLLHVVEKNTSERNTNCSQRSCSYCWQTQYYKQQSSACLIAANSVSVESRCVPSQVAHGIHVSYYNNYIFITSTGVTQCTYINLPSSVGILYIHKNGHTHQTLLLMWCHQLDYSK